MFNRLIATLTPFDAATRELALFQYELRQVRYPKNLMSLVRLSLASHALIFSLLLGFTLWHVWRESQSNPFLFNHGLLFVSQVGLVSFLAFFVLDIIATLTAIQTIHSDVQAGRWDLLRLTLLSPEQIVRAKYAIAQLRGWRYYIVMTSFRLASVALMAGAALVEPGFDGLTVAQSLSREIAPPALALVVGALFWLGLVYVAEPLWRYRAMTALGMSLSARETTGNAILRALAHLMFGWVVQGFAFTLALVLLAMVGDYAVRAPQEWGLTPQQEEVVGLVLINLYLMFFVGVVYAYFWAMRRIWLSETLRRAFNE